MTKEELFRFDPMPQPYRGTPIRFSAVGLAHSHVMEMCRALIDAGAVLSGVYDQNEELTDRFLSVYPGTPRYASEDQALSDPAVALIVSADIPVRRAPLGIRAMRAGKDFFCDKAPFITLRQAADVRACCRETGRKYFVYYAERLHNEAAVFAGQLIRRGVIGKVAHIEGVGPHRLVQQTRPAWFFDRAQTGGILIDIGSHQIEQFLFFSGGKTAEITSARTANRFHKDVPGLDDFGDVCLTADNGVTGYFRLDWNTPDGLCTWGDVRTVITGSRGYIELRKNCDVAHERTGNTVIVVNESGEYAMPVTGKVGFPYFAALLHDCADRTETAMTQNDAIYAGELAVRAQLLAMGE